MSGEKEILDLQDRRLALITGAGVIETAAGGQPKTLKLRFLEGWTRTPQGWKFVAWQSTSIPA